MPEELSLFCFFARKFPAMAKKSRAILGVPGERASFVCGSHVNTELTVLFVLWPQGSLMEHASTDSLLLCETSPVPVAVFFHLNG